MKNILVPIMLSLLVLSCSVGLYDRLNTNAISPVVTEPTVKSFELEHAVQIEWDNDAGADRYLLYRDTDPAGSFTSVVYQGTETGFIDTDISDETFYYYKLAKVRGKKEFPKSEAVLGLSGSIQRDRHESNNTSDSTGVLGDITQANIFHYSDLYDNEVIDRDWFYVSLEPRRSMLIVFDEVKNGITGEALAEDELKFNIKEGELHNVYNGVSYWLDNYSYEEKIIYFQVSVNKKTFGNKIATYRIRIDQIKNNQ
jgi:fibronectin type 3 domain-containing protein